MNNTTKITYKKNEARTHKGATTAYDIIVAGEIVGTATRHHGDRLDPWAVFVKGVGYHRNGKTRNAAAAGLAHHIHTARKIGAALVEVTR